VPNQSSDCGGDALTSGISEVARGWEPQPQPAELPHGQFQPARDPRRGGGLHFLIRCRLLGRTSSAAAAANPQAFAELEALLPTGNHWPKTIPSSL
jgi:hypothetical protein